MTIEKNPRTGKITLHSVLACLREILQNPSTDDAVLTLKAERHRRPG